MREKGIGSSMDRVLDTHYFFTKCSRCLQLEGLLLLQYSTTCTPFLYQLHVCSHIAVLFSGKSEWSKRWIDSSAARSVDQAIDVMVALSGVA